MRGRVLFGGDDLAGKTVDARARQGVAHVPEGRGVRANPEIVLSSYLGEQELPTVPETRAEPRQDPAPSPVPEPSKEDSSG